MRGVVFAVVQLMLWCSLPPCAIRAQDEDRPISSRTPQRRARCLVDENGLPKQVLICSNGTGLFAKPEEGADRIQTLGLFRRLYLYLEGERDGFHRVGQEPFGESPTGWVPSAFCLLWDHNEMLFLTKDSGPERAKLLLRPKCTNIDSKCWNS